MNSAKITIRNYRSIPYNNPITIEIDKGITFILGVNNIGKSNLLKLFYELRQSIDSHSANSGTFGIAPGSINYGSIKNQNSNEDQIVIELKGETRTHILHIVPSGGLDSNAYNQNTSYENIVESNYHPLEVKIYYELFRNSMYVGSFRTTTFQTSANYFDVSVGSSFIRQWDSWATGTSLENRIKIRSLKNELKELFGFSHFDIITNQDKTNLIVETDDGSFLLDELGGGISHFILVLGNALIKNPSFILIDEPENALHPKMQEVFVRTLASKAKYGLIATSHSIGLARSIGADRIYSLSKDSNGRLSLHQYGDNYKPSVVNSINELSYSQFVELGGNNILLVEGATDIKCFKEILRKYAIEQHFIIMDLGGSGLISESRREELSELKRLNAKSYSVIFDSEILHEDAPLKDKLQKFKNMCIELSFNVFPTEFHSTDNYLSQEVISKELGSGYTALSKYEKLNNRPPHNKWGKSLNWKMFREMKKEDFTGTKLDEFIISVLMPLTQNS